VAVVGGLVAVAGHDVGDLGDDLPDEVLGLEQDAGQRRAQQGGSRRGRTGGVRRRLALGLGLGRAVGSAGLADRSGARAGRALRGQRLLGRRQADRLRLHGPAFVIGGLGHAMNVEDYKPVTVNADGLNQNIPGIYETFREKSSTLMLTPSRGYGKSVEL
jgi:hypothetical protein